MELAPGVRWIRMVLPLALNHINLWLLRDEVDGQAGWSVVDCCISRDESKADWEEIFKTQLQGLPILRVIVTHMHPDHVGLAYWLCERWKARLWMSATDFNAARVGTIAPASFGGQPSADFFASQGVSDPDTLKHFHTRSGSYSNWVPQMPRSFRRMQDGDMIRIGTNDWRCISGYGHAPEHIALYCDALGLLISGDMLLPRISTNVSVYDIEPEGNPLQMFLDSVDRFGLLPADTLVLPSHGKPFRHMHERIRQLHEHHRDRLDEVLQACDEKPHSAAQILPIMFKRELDGHQTTFALGEALAHLHALWYAGKLRRHRGQDGVFRFTRA